MLSFSSIDWKLNKCSLPEHKRDIDPGLLISIQDLIHIMMTRDHDRAQFNYKSFGVDSLVDLDKIIIK